MQTHNTQSMIDRSTCVEDEVGRRQESITAVECASFAPYSSRRQTHAIALRLPDECTYTTSQEKLLLLYIIHHTAHACCPLRARHLPTFKGMIARLRAHISIHSSVCARPFVSHLESCLNALGRDAIPTPAMRLTMHEHSASPTNLGHRQVWGAEMLLVGAAARERSSSSLVECMDDP